MSSYYLPPRRDDRTVELIMARGQAEAQGAQRSGDIWGSTFGSVGQSLAGGLQAWEKQRAEKKQQDALTKQDQAFMRRLNDPTPLDSREIIGIYGPQKGMQIAQGIQAFQALDQKKGEEATKALPGLIRGMDALSEPLRAKFYPHVREKAIASGVIPADAIPEQYDPKMWEQISAFGKSISGEKAEPFTLSPGQQRFGPDGQPIATVAPPPQKGAAVGSFEDFVTRKYGPQPTPDQVVAARKVYGQADDRPRVDVSVAPGGGGYGTLSADGLDLAATAYRLTKALPARNAEQNGAIISKAAEQAKALGNAPVVTIQRQAAYKADGQALTKMQSMSAAAESFEQKALSQADIVAGLSEKVGRTKIPLLNQALLTGKRELLGDPDTQLLFNSITTFSSEYAKIMEGSTGSAAASSDSARKAAGELIKASLNKETLAKTLDLMRREMRLSIQGYDATIQHITERMGGVPGAPPGLPGAAPGSGMPGAGAPPPGGPEITATGPNGQKLVLRNGQWVPR